jgi:hypothetical protein
LTNAENSSPNKAFKAKQCGIHKMDSHTFSKQEPQKHPISLLPPVAAQIDIDIENIRGV